jgi:hypothetical protein
VCVRGVRRAAPAPTGGAPLRVGGGPAAVRPAVRATALRPSARRSPLRMGQPRARPVRPCVSAAQDGAARPRSDEAIRTAVLCKLLLRCDASVVEEIAAAGHSCNVCFVLRFLDA